MTALHDKHRPKQLDQVVGQSQVVKSLSRVVKDGRAHTFLFSGPSGTGKTTLARIIANMLTGGKATVHNIQDVDAATHSGADKMREIVRNTYTRAIGASPVKAIIIDECHKLSDSAFKVLLKPTEEPPSHVYWFLCTTELGKVPKPIQTRFLRYDLKPVGEDDLLDVLVKVCDVEKLKVVDEVLEAIVDSSDGSPRQALVFLESCLHAQNANEARALMRSGGQLPQVIDLCRFLVNNQGRSWVNAMKLVSALEGFEAESVRITICSYLSACLQKANSEKRAVYYLRLLQPFLTSYNQSDRLAPLLHSLGLALELDRQ